MIVDASYPVFEAKYVTESAKDYPVSINGKMRANISIDLAATEAQVHEIVLANEVVKKWVAETPIKKIIFVKGKIINLVV